jgi:hypothetical protein
MSITMPFKVATLIPASAETEYEASFAGVQAFFTGQLTDAFIEMQRQTELDNQFGWDTRHRPDRRDYALIMAPTWRRERKIRAIKRNVYGHPAGRFTRAA